MLREHKIPRVIEIRIKRYHEKEIRKRIYHYFTRTRFREIFVRVVYEALERRTNVSPWFRHVDTREPTIVVISSGEIMLGA